APLRRPGGDPHQEAAPALVGHGQKGSPILFGKPGGFVTRCSPCSSFLVPGVGGELGGYLPCVHGIPLSTSHGKESGSGRPPHPPVRSTTAGVLPLPFRCLPLEQASCRSFLGRMSVRPFCQSPALHTVSVGPALGAKRPPALRSEER